MSTGVFRQRFVGYRPRRIKLPSFPTAVTNDTGTATAVVLDGPVDGSGVIQDTGFSFASTQPVTGRARKGSASTYYKTAAIIGEITNDGLDLDVFMLPDE